MYPTLLSIVIPTKNRQKYCVESIKHIIGLNLYNTEIVIQDNSDTPVLRDYLVEHGLISKVVYKYTNEILSFVDNFSNAISACSGEYICMIGDDDSVLPNIVNVTRYAKENGIDAVVPQLLTYFWPTSNPIKPQWVNGYLSTLPFRRKSIQQIDVDSSLRKLIYNHFQGYQELSIPRIYHGIVHRNAIEAVKERAGVYFDGLTPDMFMSVCLCFTVKNAVTYNCPFTISGICPKSGSADSATGRHTGELKDAPHFRGHDTYEWIKSVPYIYTVETIWAETGLQALKKMGDEKFITMYSPKQFTHFLSMKYPAFKGRLLTFGKEYGVSDDSIESYIREYALKSKIKKFTNRVVKVATANIAKKFYNVQSIDQCCKICCDFLKIKY